METPKYLFMDKENVIYILQIFFCILYIQYITYIIYKILVGLKKEGNPALIDLAQ